MSEQETLTPAAATFNPLEHGIYTRYTTDGRIDHAAWLRACAAGDLVGTCRACGGWLLPRTPDDLGGGRFDYEAGCNGCVRVVSAPGGRVLRRSSRRNERPKGGG